MSRNRGPYAKGIVRREEILAVALEVVAQNGCRKASSREIARRVGLSQAGLMHYFGSREQLYEAVLRARDEFDNETYYLPNPTFEGFLALVAHNAEVPGLVQLYVEYSAEATAPDHPSREFFRRRYDWVREMGAIAILGAQERGEMGPAVDVAAALDLLIAAADGLQVQWALDHSVDVTGRLAALWESLCRSSWSSSAGRP